MWLYFSYYILFNSLSNCCMQLFFIMGLFLFQGTKINIYIHAYCLEYT